MHGTATCHVTAGHHVEVNGEIARQTKATRMNCRANIKLNVTYRQNRFIFAMDKSTKYCIKSVNRFIDQRIMEIFIKLKLIKTREMMQFVIVACVSIDSFL